MTSTALPLTGLTVIDLTLLESQIFMLDCQAARYLMGGDVR